MMKPLLFLTLLTALQSIPKAQAEATSLEGSHVTNHLSLGLAKSFPVSKGRKRFSSGEAHPVLGYHYWPKKEWLVSVYAQFRNLIVKKEQESVSLLSIQQESSWVSPIFHPFYVTLGGRINIFYPSRKALIPIQQYEDYGNEFAFSLHQSLIYKISPKMFVRSGMDIWRGTATTRFIASELYLSFGSSI